MLKDNPQTLQDLIPVGINPALIKWGVIIIVVVLAVSTCLYSVATNEVGVVERLGMYTRTVPPGLHMKLPFGIEKARKVRVKYLYKDEFGFVTTQPGVRTTYRKGGGADESLMLTGDLNIAVVEWIIQYRIKDPVKFLYRVRDVHQTLRDISETTMRLVVGDRSVTEVLTIGRREAGIEAESLMQKIHDDYETGIHIETVKLKDVNPPDPVKPAFNEVNEAKQEKERMINEAWSAYNKAIPAARGEAKRMIWDAEGYALQRVNHAEGDVKRFIALHKEYSQAPKVTRERLYLETMSEVLARIKGKYIVDPELKGLIPFLDLNKMGGKK